MCLTGCTPNSNPGSGSGSSAPACNPATQKCPLCCCVLAIQKLTFGGTGFHAVEKDTLGPFPAPHWDSSRAAADQSPVSYVRKTTIDLTAEFAVTTQACQAGEKVDLKANATFGSVSIEWTGSTTVNPGDTTAKATLTGKVNLPDTVTLFETSDITWQMNRCGQGWTAAGTTRNVIYVTLGAPGSAPNFWTLLDVSCRAADGKDTADDVVSASFAPFIAARGDGKGIKRKRDMQELTYWKQGMNTPAVFDCPALLSSTDGIGRCGSWARLLVNMHQVHGITSSSVVGVVPNKVVAALVTKAGSDCEFMVQNGTFVGAGSLPTPFTHEAPKEYVKTSGLPGIGKNNPQHVFPDHALVEYGGKIYDPSYGAGPFADLPTWEKGAIAGLCTGGTDVFVQDATNLRIRTSCSKGFVVYVAVKGETLSSIASKFGAPSGAALYSHPYNANFRTSHPPPGTISPGDWIFIPREISNISILERR